MLKRWVPTRWYFLATCAADLWGSAVWLPAWLFTSRSGGLRTKPFNLNFCHYLVLYGFLSLFCFSSTLFFLWSSTNLCIFSSSSFPSSFQFSTLPFVTMTYCYFFFPCLYLPPTSGHLFSSLSLSLCFYLSIRSLHSTSTDGLHLTTHCISSCVSLFLSFSILSLTFSVSHFLDSVCSTTQVIILFLSWSAT